MLIVHPTLQPRAPAVLWRHDRHHYKQRALDNMYKEEHKISKIGVSKVTLIAYKQLHGSKECLQGTVMGKPSGTPVCPLGVPAHITLGITVRSWRSACHHRPWSFWDHRDIVEWLSWLECSNRGMQDLRKDRLRRQGEGVALCDRTACVHGAVPGGGWWANWEPRRYSIVLGRESGKKHHEMFYWALEEVVKEML